MQGVKAAWPSGMLLFWVALQLQTVQRERCFSTKFQNRLRKQIPSQPNTQYSANLESELEI